MRWYSYIVGYLIVIIEGQFPERVINMALARGILLWDIIELGEKKILLKIRLHNFRPLRHIVRQCNCRMRIFERRGLPFQLSRVKKRKVLALGSIIFLLGLYGLSSFVWFVEVKGTEDLSIREVKEIAEKKGVRTGAIIGNLDVDKLEVQIQEEHPKIAWVGISITGTKVTIEIAEKVLIPETLDHQKANLVAKDHGIIAEMLVLRGTPQVKEGDRVEKGQILISGVVYPEIIINQDGTTSPTGEPEFVRARGVVRGRVNHSIIASCPLTETIVKYTGRQNQQVILAYSNYNIIINGPKEIPFENYKLDVNSKNILSWRNIKVPVEIITKVFVETEREIITHGYEGAFQEAIKRAETTLQQQLSPGARVINKEVKLNPTGLNTQGLVEVEVIWECIEDIGIHEPLAPISPTS